MAREYRKKPVVVEAVQWTGNNHAEMCEFIDPEVFEIIPRVGLVIHTLEGDHHASPGDYIIKGVNGEFYPCKPDIFAKTYEATLPTLTPQNEWVSVEDAVPDPGERVLATDGIFVGEAYRSSANSWFRHTGFPWRDGVTGRTVRFWMPLPAPPGKGNNVPTNEPLTIKELREMDGEPVYDYLGQEWYVIQEYYDHELTMTDGTRFFDDDEIDGVDKRFYRRPTEGEVNA